MLPIIFTKINYNTISIATDNDSESDTVQVTGPRKRFPKIGDITHNNSRLEPMNALHNIP